MSPIDINKKYIYRSGASARIICTDKAGKYPVVSVDIDGDVFAHMSDGRCLPGNRDSDCDLIEVTKP